MFIFILPVGSFFQDRKDQSSEMNTQIHFLRFSLRKQNNHFNGRRKTACCNITTIAVFCYHSTVIALYFTMFTLFSVLSFLNLSKDLISLCTSVFCALCNRVNFQIQTLVYCIFYHNLSISSGQFFITNLSCTKRRETTSVCSDYEDVLFIYFYRFS